MREYPFPLSQQELGQVLSAALSRGGNYADVFLEHTAASSMELQDGQVSQATSVVLYGAGVRVLCGERTGYAYTMDLSMPQMMKAARSAACIVGDTTDCNPIAVQAMQRVPLASPNRYPELSPLAALGVSARKQMLMQIDALARQQDSRVVKVRAAINDRNQHVCIANSNGTITSDHRPSMTIFVRVVMEHEGRTEMGFASESLMMGAEFATPERFARVTQRAVQNAAFLFDAIQPQGGEMPVVMAAGASGILLHEAIGHAFEADFIRKGTSIFTDSMGQMVCDPSISIVDDGTQPSVSGALNIDDEGVPGQRTMLVQNGRLTSFLHDRISAAHFGVSPTGNGRRESFRQVPLPRMRSTYMLAGQCTEDDIIRSVKRGIYAQTFTNGQVQIGAGDFTFYMKQGYLIEDGHLTTPIRDINIIGNGPRALADISMVADNLTMDPSAGMCGKGGQSVPVSQGLPSVLVRSLVVG